MKGRYARCPVTVWCSAAVLMAGAAVYVIWRVAPVWIPAVGLISMGAAGAVLIVTGAVLMARERKDRTPAAADGDAEIYHYALVRDAAGLHFECGTFRASKIYDWYSVGRPVMAGTENYTINLDHEDRGYALSELRRFVREKLKEEEKRHRGTEKDLEAAERVLDRLICEYVGDGSLTDMVPAVPCADFRI